MNAGAESLGELSARVREGTIVDPFAEHALTGTTVPEGTCRAHGASAYSRRDYIFLHPVLLKWASRARVLHDQGFDVHLVLELVFRPPSSFQFLRQLKHSPFSKPEQLSAGQWKRAIEVKAVEVFGRLEAELGRLIQQDCLDEFYTTWTTALHQVFVCATCDHGGVRECGEPVHGLPQFKRQ
eukprot:11901287-Alexandrium_andersonii.AAC.1